MIIKSIDNKSQAQNQVSTEPHCVDLKRNMITKKVRSIQNQTEANLAQINLQEAAERVARSLSLASAQNWQRGMDLLHAEKTENQNSWCSVM